MTQRSFKFDCGGEIIIGDDPVWQVVFPNGDRIKMFRNNTFQYWPADLLTLTNMQLDGEINSYGAKVIFETMRANTFSQAVKVMNVFYEGVKEASFSSAPSAG